MNFYQSLLDMRNRRAVLFLGFSVVILVFIIHLKHEIYTLTSERDALTAINDDLHVRLEKVINLQTLQSIKANNALPTVYAITPTYKRYEQKAELTRISQTLALVPNIHWIVIEDATENSLLVTKLLQDSSLIHYTHLSVKTPWDQQLRRSKQRWTKHRGVEQRNLGLHWLRKNRAGEGTGAVYFMDDDNTYNIKIFSEIIKIRKVGIWPVGLVGGLSAEQPIIDKETGKVTSYRTGWKPERAFATDMAGFAINLTLILSNPDAVFSYKMEKGNLESDFLSLLITKEELEPLADNCTKVFVWHTRTEKTKVNSEIPGLEV
ncbi:Glucuronyltransferase I [Carabus blaptoides fortunei]